MRLAREQIQARGLIDVSGKGNVKVLSDFLL